MHRRTPKSSEKVGDQNRKTYVSMACTRMTTWQFWHSSEEEKEEQKVTKMRKLKKKKAQISKKTKGEDESGKED